MKGDFSVLVPLGPKIAVERHPLADLAIMATLIKGFDG